MDLKTFVEETISQLMQGVAEADLRARAFGGQVSPRGIILSQPGATAFGMINPKGEDLPVILALEFDVALETVDSSQRDSNGGVSLQVASISGAASREHSEKTVSRVKFKVPVTLPSEFAAGHTPPTPVPAARSIPRSSPPST